MKPSFALNLSHDGLSLLHRTTGGWRTIGDVELDDPELPEKLRYLRKSVTELAGGQMASKLVIPSSQILYQSIDPQGATGAQLESIVKTALAGATPYDLEDLVYDWVETDNGFVQVAAVARETLDEAESFAVEHRFNPVCFVAIPENDEFGAEPFFGQSGFCETLFQDGEQVERDAEPIVITGRFEPQEPDSDDADVEVVEDEAVSEPEAEDLQEPVDEADEEPKHDPFDVSGTFTTRRSGSTEDEFSTSFDRVEPRFALYGEKASPEPEIDTDSAPKLGGAKKTPEITPMPVTAPKLTGSKFSRPRKKVKVAPDVQEVVYAKALLNGRDTAQASARPAPASEAEAMTVFGARKQIEVGGKTKYLGLMLTVGLVLVLILVALLSGLFLDKPLSISRLWSSAPVVSVSEPVIAAVVEPVVVEDAPLTTAPELEATAPAAPSEIELALLSPAEQTADELFEPTVDEIAEAEPQLIVPDVFDHDQATEYYAQSGIWPLAPFPPVELSSDRIDNLYVASIDRRVLSHDAIALPGIARALIDIQPGLFLSPPAAGTTFDFDERGLVRALPEGALTPDGILVYSGRPATVPTLRPGSAAAIEPEPETVTPAIPLIRPTARPEGLVEINDRAQLGGRSRSELAAIRPTARPVSVQEESTGADQTPTELAILNSRSPTLRPANFSDTVEKAMVAAALASAERGETQVASAAAIAAPQLPAIPTRASVAREATVNKALNLSKVNLIGVYGSSSDRRALVRLKSGRYVKVQIGDRLDGGKVAAIDTNTLRYIKGSRTLTLEMPRG